MISVLLNDAIKDNIIIITETWIRYSQSDNKNIYDMVLAFKVCYIAWAHCIYFEINAKYFFLS